jgi:formate hydrogenlyase subunit 4
VVSAVDIATQLLTGLGQAALVAAAAPLTAGLIKTAKARLQNRRGPGILQPYYDLAKFLRKDSVVSPTTSWLFAAAPVVYFAAAAAAAALAPVLAPFYPGAGGALADMFVLLYLFALGRFFLALASLDAGSAFGAWAARARCLSPCWPSRRYCWRCWRRPCRRRHRPGRDGGEDGDDQLGSGRGVCGRGVFPGAHRRDRAHSGDNPDTHLELTMVHEGMILEYSGRPLGLIHWAAAIKQLVMIALFAVLFLPGAPATWPAAAQAALLAAKVAATALALAAVETATNKMRLFRVPAFMAVAGVLSLLALVAQ